MSTDVLMGEAFDHAVNDLDRLIGRHFAANRSIHIDRDVLGRYGAFLDDRQVFPWTPNLDVVIRFVRAFAIQTDGVTVDENSVEYWRCEREFGHWSFRAPTLRLV